MTPSTNTIMLFQYSLSLLDIVASSCHHGIYWHNKFAIMIYEDLDNNIKNEHISDWLFVGIMVSFVGLFEKIQQN